jgi:hypothetical protein
VTEEPVVAPTTSVGVCGPNDLRVELYTRQDVFNYAEGLHAFVRLTYIGQGSCTISTALNDMNLNIKLGPDDFYNSLNCPVEDHGLLFSKGDTSEQEIVWNMHGVGADQCSSGTLAPEGYYTASLMWNSSKGLVSNPVVFRVG